MWATAFLYSGITAIILALVLIVFDWDEGEVGSSIITAIIYFVITTPLTALYFHQAAPVLNAGGKFTMVLVYLVAMLIAAAVRGWVTSDDWWGGVIAICVVLVIALVGGGLVSLTSAWGQDTADKLAGKVEVIKEETGKYPETDTEHISLMPLEAARFKADQALTQTDAKNTNLSTSYEVSKGSKQSIDNHLYWVFELKLGGTAAQERNKYIIPGYVVVDAEDPSATPQLKLGYKMAYYPGGVADHSMTRLLWNEYPSNSVDDLTLEINDDWQPYYTASLNTQVYTFGSQIPQSLVLIDPTDGKITKYKLGEAPQWVDRVYSAAAAKRLMNWYGRWGAGKKEAPWRSGLPWAKEGKSNRYKVSGEPNLVYTKDKGGSHPEWQMILTSMKTDTAAIYVALFDAREAKVRLYQVPNLQIESAVVKTFEDSSKNLKKYTATEPALHLIYGRLTWVTAYINVNDGEEAENQSLQAIGLVAADAAQGNNVQYNTSKGAVLDDYQEWLAGSKSPNSPASESKERTTEGTVEHFSSVVRDGDTSFYLILKEQPNKVFRGKVDDETVELGFAKPGDKVRITYSDTSEDIILIKAFDDLELSVGSGG